MVCLKGMDGESVLDKGREGMGWQGFFFFSFFLGFWFLLVSLEMLTLGLG